MGLDCIPHEYPCAREGTAILVADEDGERINCQATIDADRCPWKRESARRGTPVYGVLGVPCWYRGKAGNWMLEELASFGPPGDGFYGETTQEEPGPQLSPEYCTELASWMEDHAEAYAALHRNEEDGGKDSIETYRYAAWWLRFVAEHAGGSDTWY